MGESCIFLSGRDFILAPLSQSIVSSEQKANPLPCFGGLSYVEIRGGNGNVHAVTLDASSLFDAVDKANESLGADFGGTNRGSR